MLLHRKQWAVCGARGKNMHSNSIVGKNGACETLASARGCEAGSYLLPEQSERAGCVKGKGAVKTKKKVGMTEDHSLIAFPRAPARHDSVLLSIARGPVAC